MHTHHLQPWEWVAIGAIAKFLFIDCIAATIPPYTGNNFWIKWLIAAMHAGAANWKNVHIPGSPADLAAMPKSNGDTKDK